MSINVAKYIKRISVTAKSAAVELATATTEQKNNALHAIADALMARQQWLQQENDKDLHIGKTKGLDAAMLDRLMLNVERITAMAEGLRQVATLAEPIGGITDMEYRPNGLQIGRMRVPLGVIGIIYESRPNVTADAAALCLKSGNATILRGGSEAIHSNQAIADCIQAGLEQVGLSKTCVQVIKTTDRAAVGELLRAKDTVDVIIPRGGKGLIQRVSDESLIPVIKHLDGICHVYVDETADLDKAVKVALNAKTHRYGVCNAMETLLVAEGIANDFLPVIADKLMAKEVELRGCAKTTAILTGLTDCKLATEADWAEEYLAPILSIRVVTGLTQAIEPINYYGSHHTDSIMTENYNHSRRFLREVDSSSVMVNASTRFADGFEYGLGAEIGISTDKLHARGPVGLEGLTSLKYVVLGDGHIRR